MAKTTYTHAEWLAEGKRRFGDDFMKWRFQCPACGHIASVQDIKDAGGDPETQGYFCCIGRFTGQGSPVEDDDDITEGGETGGPTNGGVLE